MVSGEFFEAGTSRGYPATLENQGISLLLVTNGSSLTLDPDALSISLRLAHLPRRIHFPDGSMFTTNDNDQVDSILRSLGRSPKGSMISFFETGWRWTLLALFVIPVVLYLLFSIGMPLVAQPLASMVPDTVKNELDRNVIEFLDNRLLQPSSLSLERQRKLTEKLTRFSKFAPNTRLLFRGGGLLGANALALPGGTIIFTDEIIELADYDGELVAVYLHEIGHVAGDHAMRNIIQMTGVSFIMGWLLGDLTLITDIALVGAPVFLQKMVYSRRLEREADIYAMTLMPITGYSKKCFADMMEKLSTQHGGKMDDFPDYLSSHPPTRQRVAMARSDQSCSEVRSKPGSKAPVSNQSVWTETTIATVDFEISPPEVDTDPSWNNLERIMAGDRDYSPVASFGPIYPRPALIERIQGYCVIQYTVTSLGTVRDPSVMEDQCTNSLFIEPSIEATLKFKFRPRIIDSVAVDVPGVQNKFTYQISNDLQDD